MRELNENETKMIIIIVFFIGLVIIGTTAEIKKEDKTYICDYKKVGDTYKPIYCLIDEKDER